MAWASRPAASSHSGCSAPSRSAPAMAHRRRGDRPRTGEQGERSADPPRPTTTPSCRRRAASATRSPRRASTIGQSPPRLSMSPVTRVVMPDSGGHVGADVGVEAGVLHPAGEVVVEPAAVGQLPIGQPLVCRVRLGVEAAGRSGPWPPRRGSRVGVTAGYHGIIPSAQLDAGDPLGRGQHLGGGERCRGPRGASITPATPASASTSATALSGRDADAGAAQTGDGASDSFDRCSLLRFLQVEHQALADHRVEQPVGVPGRPSVASTMSQASSRW